MHESLCVVRDKEEYFCAVGYGENSPHGSVRLMPERVTYTPSKCNLSAVPLPPTYIQPLLLVIERKESEFEESSSTHTWPPHSVPPRTFYHLATVSFNHWKHPTLQ